MPNTSKLTKKSVGELSQAASQRPKSCFSGRSGPDSHIYSAS